MLRFTRLHTTATFACAFAPATCQPAFAAFLPPYHLHATLLPAYAPACHAFSLTATKHATSWFAQRATRAIAACRGMALYYSRTAVRAAAANTYAVAGCAAPAIATLATLTHGASTYTSI